MAFDPLRDLRAWQERLERLVVQPGSAWTPPIDVYETSDRYVLSAELPGLVREQIELAVEDNRLTIRGSRPASIPDGVAAALPPGRARLRQLLADLRVHDAIASDRISADLRDGVLTVTLPKIPPAPARRIDVQ